MVVRLDVQFKERDFGIGKRIISRLRIGAALIAKKTANTVHKEIVKEIQQNNLVASGALLRSVSVDALISSKNKYSFGINLTPKARAILKGRRPHSSFPNIAKIQKWMVFKGLDGTTSGAFLIARKIARDGIPPKDFITPAVKKAENKISGYISILDDSFKTL